MVVENPIITAYILNDDLQKNNIGLINKPDHTLDRRSLETIYTYLLSDLY